MDYRLLNLPNEGHYFYPLSNDTKSNLESKWKDLVGGDSKGEEVIV